MALTSPPLLAPAPRRAGAVVRVALALALLAVGVLGVWNAGAIRTVEAESSASVMGALTSSETYVRRETASFYWLMGTADARGLRVTAECSVAYVIGPLVGLCGLLALLRRLPARRILAAALAGVSIIVGVNLVRIAMVAVAVTHFPSERAMWWWHVVIGSVVSLAGIGAGLASTVRIAFGGARASAAPVPPRTHPPAPSDPESRQP